MRLELRAAGARHPAALADAPPALNQLSAVVQPGEQLAVIGPSGAGKTTLLQVIACALKALSGSVLLEERDPWQLPRGELQRLRGELFLAPQVPPLPPRQRVVTAVLAGRLPQLSLAQSVRSLFYPSDIEGAARALSAFDLADKLFERVDRLSGGERQRVGLARALVSRARLLLVDEPLSALDPARAEQALLALTRFARETGATLVVSLHDVPLALHHFPRVIGLRAGTLEFDLPCAEVTPQRLGALYAQEPDELAGPAPASEPLLVPAPRVAMQCR